MPVCRNTNRWKKHLLTDTNDDDLTDSFVGSKDEQREREKEADLKEAEEEWQIDWPSNVAQLGEKQ